jgi:hypothetical protein
MHSKEWALQQYEDSIAEIDIAIEALTYKKDNKPLRILGIRVTRQLEISIYTFLFSLIFAGTQYYIENKGI